VTQLIGCRAKFASPVSLQSGLLMPGSLADLRIRFGVQAPAAMHFAYASVVTSVRSM
jgi:hypothetical protein